MSGKKALGASLGLALLSLLVPASRAGAQPGALDATFGAGGLVSTDFAGGIDAGAAVVRQPDGRLVVAGGAGVRGGRGGHGAAMQAFGLARFLPDGSADLSFGDAGKVTTRVLDGTSAIFALALDPAGRIVAAGRACPDTNCRMAVARYLPDGSLDRAFGSGGITLLNFPGKDARATGVAVLESGKIAVAGTAEARAVLACLDASGNVDATFGAGGAREIQIGGGETIAYGLSANGSGTLVMGGSALGPNDHDFALAFFLPSGDPDTDCGVGGTVVTDFATRHDAAYAIAASPDGSIFLAGETVVEPSGSAPAPNPDQTSTGFAVAKYTETGQLDTGFGVNGRVLVPFAGFEASAAALTVLPSGIVAVAGHLHLASGTQIVLAFLGPDGMLVQRYGVNGMVRADSAGPAAASGVAIVEDGKLVVAGTAVAGTEDFALLRYVAADAGDANWDGRVDVSDIFAIINRLFAGGPMTIGHADANGDEIVNVTDVFHLINFIYANGPAPF